MNYIYRIYSNKTIAFFSSKDDAISLLYHIPNAKIEVFNNLTPIGIYHINNKKLFFNDDPVVLDGYMKKWFEQNITEEKSELNIFIPLTTVDENINKKLSFEELQLKIKQLEEEANKNNEKIEEIQEIFENKQESFNEKKEEFDEEKKNFDKQKEYVYQLKNKLEADKRVYFIIKEQLESGELTEDSIPILFIDKYPIFKFLDNNNLIDNSDSISTDEINNYLNIAPNYKVNTNIDNSNSFNDLFSSSDPIYFKKDKNITTDSSHD
jgi:hypothetical protein